MELIDFERPFVLGVFWAVVMLALWLAFAWLRYTTMRAISEQRKTAEIQQREINTSASKIAVLEERAKLRDEQREIEQRLATQQLGNAEDRSADSRFRAQGVAAVAMALENWLRHSLFTLDEHGIEITPPPPWFGKHRREHDAYPVIEQAREEELNGQISAYIQSVGGQLDWDLSPKEPT